MNYLAGNYIKAQAVRSQINLGEVRLCRKCHTAFTNINPHSLPICWTFDANKNFHITMGDRTIKKIKSDGVYFIWYNGTFTVEFLKPHDCKIRLPMV